MGSETMPPGLDERIEINPKRQLARGDDSVYVSMQDLDEHRRTVPSYGRREFNGSGSRFSNGDTLLARITPCLENGKTAYVDFLKEGQVTHGSTEFIVLSGKMGITDSLFVYYLARSPEFRSFAIARMEGSSGRQRVPATTLKKVPYELPLLPEQRAIAHILDSLDDKIELTRQMNRTLEKMAQATFKSWFIDFDPVKRNRELRRVNCENSKETFHKNSPFTIHHSKFDSLFPDSFEDSELGEIPKGWEVQSLDEIADFLNGLACQKFPVVDGEPFLPVIKIRELRQGVSGNTDRATSKAPAKFLVNDGDVLFSWSGSLLVDVWTGGKGILNQHVFKVTSNKYPKWFFFLWTAHNLEEFQSIAAGKVTTMGHIKRHHLTDAKVIVPPTAVLEAATEQIAPLFDLRIENRLQSLRLSRLRNTLLPKLISGELPIPDAEKLLEGIE